MINQSHLLRLMLRMKRFKQYREFPLGVAISGPVEVMGLALDGTVKYHNVYKQPGETGRRLLKAFLLQRLKLQELLGDYSISRWRNNNDLQRCKWKCQVLVRERKQK
jgi:hypothetical protein